MAHRIAKSPYHCDLLLNWALGLQDAIAKGHSYYSMFKRKYGVQYEE